MLRRRVVAALAFSAVGFAVAPATAECKRLEECHKEIQTLTVDVARKTSTINERDKAFAELNADQKNVRLLIIVLGGLAGVWLVSGMVQRCCCSKSKVDEQLTAEKHITGILTSLLKAGKPLNTDAQLQLVETMADLHSRIVAVEKRISQPGARNS